MRDHALFILAFTVLFLAIPGATDAREVKDTPYFTYGECDGKLYYSILEDGKWYVVSFETENGKPVKKWEAPGVVAQILDYKGKIYYCAIEETKDPKIYSGAVVRTYCEGKSLKTPKMGTSPRIGDTTLSFCMHDGKPLVHCFSGLSLGTKIVAQGIAAKDVCCVPDKGFAYKIVDEKKGSATVFLNGKPIRSFPYKKPKGMFGTKGFMPKMLMIGDAVYYDFEEDGEQHLYKNDTLIASFKIADGPVTFAEVCGKPAYWRMGKREENCFYVYNEGPKKTSEYVEEVMGLGGKPYMFGWPDRENMNLVEIGPDGKETPVFSINIYDNFVAPQFFIGEDSRIGAFGQYFEESPVEVKLAVKMQGEKDFWWMSENSVGGRDGRRWCCVFANGKLYIAGEKKRSETTQPLYVASKGKTESKKDFEAIIDPSFQTYVWDNPLSVVAGKLTYFAQDEGKLYLFHGDKEIQLSPPPDGK